jgi:hypothetical protein
MGNETDPKALRASLLDSANPNLVGAPWRKFNDQGHGLLDVPAALAELQAGPRTVPHVITGVLKPNVLGRSTPNTTRTYESSTITVNGSVNHDFVFEVSKHTSRVTIEVFDIVTPDNSAYAYWPNALEYHLQSAKRTAVNHPIAGYWYPFAFGDSFTIVVEDGPWTLEGALEAYQPMEPGLMKLSLLGDYSNESPVSFKVRITRENYAPPKTGLVASGNIKMGDTFFIPVEIPEGTSQATFDLVWNRDWSMFPTSDLDLILLDPEGNLASIDGATLNSPERAVITDPMAGTWTAIVDGFEMYKPDMYWLYVMLE